MDDLYLHPKFPKAVDLWASFFAKTKEEIQYSNWRHLNIKRQKIENKIWKRLISSDSRILDIGCGKGFFLKRLYDNFDSAIEYYGIDISSVATYNAQNYFSLPKYFVSPAERLPFEDKSFDYIQIISTLEHVSKPSLVIKEAYRVLKDKGYLYIVLHKKSFDPLIFLTLYSLVKMFSRKDKDFNSRKYSLPISFVRDKIFKYVKKVNFEMVGRGDLVSYLNVSFYRKLHLPMSFLLWIANVTNNSNISIFKNLEYIVYQK